MLVPLNARLIARDYVHMRQTQLRIAATRNANAAFARAAIAFCAWLAGDAMPSLFCVASFVAVVFGIASLIGFWNAGYANIAAKMEIG